MGEPTVSCVSLLVALLSPVTLQEIKPCVPAVSLQAALEAADSAIFVAVGLLFQGSGNYDLWGASIGFFICISQQRPK